jgi:putative ABC transport system ATP-binding protein
LSFDIIRCVHLSKSFLNLAVLKDIDLAIPTGSIFMILGPSGCGKTTLISIIAGILKKDSGTCMLLNHDLDHMSSKELTAFRGKNIGFVFQNYHLISTISVLDNAMVPLLINRVDETIAQNKAREILSKVGLSSREHLYPDQLSGGEQQRLAIARGVIHEPQILICDEPTAALDHETGDQVVSLISNMNKNLKTTAVIVTHDHRILKYADYIAHMEDGRIVSIEQPKKG